MIQPKLIIKDMPDAKFASESMLKKFDELFVKSSPEVLSIRSPKNEFLGNELISMAENLQDFIAEQFHIVIMKWQELSNRLILAGYLAWLKCW